jgi:hypothetical protein
MTKRREVSDEGRESLSRQVGVLKTADLIYKHVTTLT